MRRYLAFLDTTDFLNIGFFLLMALGMLAYSGTIGLWLAYVVIDLAVAAAIAVLSAFAYTRSSRWKLFHGFYMMLCIPLAFKEVYSLVPAMHPQDVDATLIAIDHALFGVNPTQWLAQFAHPLLTEILQLSYATFYFLPLILAVDLYRKKRMDASRKVFLTIMLGFYLSYIGYAAMPAIGPRFTLHDFARTDTELPGLLLTPFLRAYTNTGESVPPGTADPARHVQRDCFPSGHTQMTLLVIFLAFRYRARTRWFLGINGSLLIIATVYLRYHYVIDLIGGAFFAVATYYLMPPFDRWWRSTRERIRRSQAIWLREE